MAKTVYNDHVREMHGAYTKDGTIHRRKTFRDSNGKVKGLGVNESYKIMNPRDWKKKPATGKELEHQLHFQQACAETKRILLAAKLEAYAAAHPDTSPAAPTAEDLATLRYWQDRFNAQLKKGEPEAPIDPNTHKRKIYLRLDAFIRTCLLREMKQNDPQNAQN